MQLPNVQDAASQPFPSSLPPSSLFSSLSVLQEAHPLSSPRKGSRSCQVTLSEAHCPAGVHFLLIPALPASSQYVSVNLLHPQTLHMITDAQGSGAGEGLVRDAAAGGKEGIMKKTEDKY